jgi:hypothetical protein
VSVNVYVDRATGNHWTLENTWMLRSMPSRMLWSVNAEHSQEPGGFHDPIQVEGGFVARGNVVDHRWSVAQPRTPEELRAAEALKNAACKTNSTVV